MPNDNNTPTSESQKPQEKYNSKTNNTLNQTPPQIDQLLDENTALKKENEELKRQLENAIIIPNISIPFPEEAPEKWKDYKKDYPDALAIDFFMRVYKKWIDSNSIYQDLLKKIDGKLYKDIENYCYRVENKLSDYIPPKTVRRKLMIDAIDWGDENVKEILRLDKIRHSKTYKNK